MKLFFIGLFLTIVVGLEFVDTEVSVVGAVLDLWMGLVQMGGVFGTGVLLVSMEK